MSSQPTTTASDVIKESKFAGIMQIFDFEQYSLTEWLIFVVVCILILIVFILLCICIGKCCCKRNSSKISDDSPNAGETSNLRNGDQLSMRKGSVDEGGYQVGTNVIAYDDDGRWSNAEVIEVKAYGKYKVKFDNTNKEKTVNPGQIKPLSFWGSKDFGDIITM